MHDVYINEHEEIKQHTNSRGIEEHLETALFPLHHLVCIGANGRKAVVGRRGESGGMSVRSLACTDR